MEYFGKGDMLTNSDLNTFVHKIQEKYTVC
jgi:hypothetical protein